MLGKGSEIFIPKLKSYEMPILIQVLNELCGETKQDITMDHAENNITLGLDFEENGVDELYSQAVNIVIKNQKVSTSFIQRYLQIGYNRAARIVEKMEEDGIVTTSNNAGKRAVLKEK